MIPCDEGEQGRLAGTVGPHQLPVLSLLYGPVEPVDDDLLPVGDAQGAHLYPRAGGQGRGRHERRGQLRALPLGARQLGHLPAAEHGIALPRQQQAAFAEQAEVSGKGGDLVEAVDDHHQPLSLPDQLCQQPHQLLARALIQPIEGLIQNQQLGSPQQGAGQQQLAPLPARKIAIGALPQGLDAEACQQRSGLHLLSPRLQHQGRYPIARFLLFPQHVGVAPLPVQLPQLLLRLEGEAHGPHPASHLPCTDGQLAAQGRGQRRLAAAVATDKGPAVLRGETKFWNNQSVVATKGQGGGLPLQ